MAALRQALAGERSASIQETHSRLDEHHAGALWVGAPASENTTERDF